MWTWNYKLKGTLKRFILQHWISLLMKFMRIISHLMNYKLWMLKQSGLFLGITTFPLPQKATVGWTKIHPKEKNSSRENNTIFHIFQWLLVNKEHSEILRSGFPNSFSDIDLWKVHFWHKVKVKAKNLVVLTVFSTFNLISQKEPGIHTLKIPT